MVDEKSEIERIQNIARTVQRALSNQEVASDEPSRARIVTRQNLIDADKTEDPHPLPINTPDNEKKLAESDNLTGENKPEKAAPTDVVQTDLDQLSLHLQGVLAKLRQPSTTRNPTAVLQQPPKTQQTSRAPQINKLITKLQSQLHKLEDEAEKTRLSILDELGRFDSQQRKILTEAATMIAAYEEQGSYWLTQQRSEIKQERAELRRIRSLVEALAKTSPVEGETND